MRARFADGVRPFAGRATPLIVRIANFTEVIMTVATGAPPVIGTSRFGRKAFVRRTEPVTAVGALRQRGRVFLLTSRAIPVMCATGTRCFRIAAAGFAVPVAVANSIGCMPIGTVRTPPHMRAVVPG